MIRKLAPSDHNWPDGALRAARTSPPANSGSQSNFSRSHERTPRCSTCNSHSNDAAVPAPYLPTPGTQSYAETHAPRSFGRAVTDSERSAGSLGSERSYGEAEDFDQLVSHDVHNQNVTTKTAGDRDRHHASTPLDAGTLHGRSPASPALV
ncbi:hypothetical protein BVI434_480008 [Burkholderia vietnamiensis]|nr:hypothetical protein BVI434_480008 [Burkholderia vietnamiensis]